MTATTIDEIPAALPTSESEETREKLLKQAAAENPQANSDELSAEPEGEEEEFDEAAAAKLAKPSKKKLFLAFVCFVVFFVFLLAAMCWFFGIGVFASTKKQTVDRTVKPNQSQPAPATEDEKLKMALNLVADKTPGSGDSNNLIPANQNGEGGNESSVIASSPTKAVDLNEPVIVPDSFPQPNLNSVNAQSATTNGESAKTPNIALADRNSNASNGNQSNPVVDAPKRNENETQAVGRSLFFGVQRQEKQEKSVSNLLPQNGNRVILNSENVESNAVAPIPFGTLLPVRFLGAVFTLRASGGLVRMELTRAVSGKNYSYPAGTLLIGTLRGSEYKRAFVSVVGLIDPESGGLVKFEGEVMGGDGASGVIGRRRKIKSAWSRVLAGLRDAGTMTLQTLGSRRSGGTVVISDSTSRASGVLSQELSGIAGGSGGKSDEFVEISAGTNAYILVTDLPDEVSGETRLAQNQKSATGLTDEELANLFSEGSPAKIRAALPKMTPQFRRLAEQVLAAMDSE